MGNVFVKIDNRFLSITLLAASLVWISCNKDGSTTSPVDNNNGGGSTTPTFTIDTIAQIGEYPAIAIDKNGKPHVSYLNHSDGYVKYAVKNGSSWAISSIEYVARTNGSLANEGLSSIALDAQDNPHLCFMSGLFFDPIHSSSGSIDYRYAKKNGTAWTISSIPLPNDPLITSYVSAFWPSAESSIVVDAITGIAHVALQMAGGRSGDVLGYWRTGLTSALILDNSDRETGYQNSIALDGNGYPSISYESRKTGHLKYARWNGSAFNVETVDSMPGIYWQDRLSSIAIDPSGNPHIAYYGVTGYYKYAHKTGGTWSIESLDEYWTSYPSLSFCLDRSGNPRVALVRRPSDLVYGYINGSSWSFTTVDKNVIMCAIAADKSGKIHIVYNQQVGSNSILKHAMN